MRNRLPLGLWLVSILQFIAPLCLPPSILAGITPVMWALIAALFVALGVFLLGRRAWARVATIFVQGFNIIVRLLVLVGHVATQGTDDVGVTIDFWMLGTFVVSMALSTVILYYIDQPDVQMLVQQV